MTTPYSDSVSAKADGTGKAVFNFRPAQAKHVIQCAVTVDGAPSTATSQATVGIAGGVGRPWGSWTGANASQGLQFISPEILSVVATGLTAGTDYTAFLEGVDYDSAADFVPYMSPSQPYTTAVSVAGGSLKFQHNSADVATEPVIDFEDAAGVTWTLTDDPAGSRVQVSASGISSGLALIASRVLAAPAPSVTFSAIPGTFNHLRLTAVARSAAGVGDFFTVQLNGDTAAHYDLEGGNVNAPASISNLAQPSWKSTAQDLTSAASASADSAGLLQIDLPLYAGTTFRKIGQWTSGVNDPGGIDTIVALVAWRSAAAVTSMKIATNTLNNFVAGSAFYLYGIL